ncbi:hypothetical protein LBMAG53_26510 [Planctomycetota bacterium]|nr:hypothetical protein LBMAG53_26510 [Planctomycetota bacterium]
MALAVGLSAVVAPSLHLVSDVLEWATGGFTRTQLLVTYAAFLPMPFLLLGLHVLQKERGGWPGLLGALLYGVAFVYFLHTALVALEESIADYDALWQRLGWVYSVHGAMMIGGGALFGVTALQARVLSPLGLSLFLAGIAMNLACGLTTLPDIFQTVGSAVRNLGLICVGVGILRGQTRVSGMEPG